MKDTQKLVISFIEEMKKEKDDIFFTFEYDQVEDIYRIFHSYTSLHEDKEFRLKMNRAYTKWFSDNDFYSVSIILNRKMASSNFVDSHNAEQITNVKINLETDVETEDKNMDNCSDEISDKTDDWSINRDEGAQTIYYEAA